MDQNEKSNLLTKKPKKPEKWYQKPCNIIWFCVLALVVIFFLYIIIPKYNAKIELPAKNSMHILSEVKTNGDYLKKCAPQIACEPNAKYRSINGSCNNLYVPTWGVSTTPYLRLLDASYSDGYHKVRIQQNGSALPLARVINLELFLNREVYNVDVNNVLLMAYGQLLAHDLTGLPKDSRVGSHGEVPACCDTKTVISTDTRCDTTIFTPKDDPVYSKLGVFCQESFRFQTSKNFSCSQLYPTTFFNTKTSFIDVSELYGSTDDIAHHLRTMEDGKLKFSKNSNNEMFCSYASKDNKSRAEREVKFQYETGDPDVNQNLGITSLQTLFLRFHNYIADRLKLLNPLWNDETIYQETRRIVIGVAQRITYKEFLPIVIGKDFQELYGINEENIYDPSIDPSLAQEFANAGFRALHTLIPVQFNFMNKDYKIESAINITDWMLNPGLLPINDHFTEILKGLLETAGRVPQHSYNFFVSNFMFREANNSELTGLDLLSIDIMASRDVGLQPYNQYRRLCGLPLAKNFDDLADLIHLKDIVTLRKLYNSVDEIDLMVGILLERLSEGAVVGPTARCLIADSLYRLKAGDRFFYDVQGQPGSFTPDQLKVIQETTFAHILCATSKVDQVQKDIFKMVDHNLFPTVKLFCNSDFIIDLSAWKQQNDNTEL